MRLLERGFERLVSFTSGSRWQTASATDRTVLANTVLEELFQTFTLEMENARTSLPAVEPSILPNQREEFAVSTGSVDGSQSSGVQISASFDEAGARTATEERAVSPTEHPVPDMFDEDQLISRAYQSLIAFGSLLTDLEMPLLGAFADAVRMLDD